MAKSKDVPFIAFGNDELSKMSVVKKTDKITCPKCGKKHKLECATNSEGQKTDLLMFYNCGGKSYLGAISGRLIPNKESK
jgi:hypothetical protein